MPDLFKKMILKKKKIISFPLKENWNDIGTLKDYNGAQK
jgi:NDP-sugar pyrophosphorylase family protein